MEFEAACLKELQRKKASHRCVKVNRQVERTEQLRQDQIDQFVNDVAIDRIHQHRFNQLVRQGILVSV